MTDDPTAEQTDLVTVTIDEFVARVTEATGVRLRAWIDDRTNTDPLFGDFLRRMVAVARAIGVTADDLTLMETACELWKEPNAPEMLETAEEMVAAGRSVARVRRVLDRIIGDTEVGKKKYVDELVLYFTSEDAAVRAIDEYSLTGEGDDAERAASRLLSVWADHYPRREAIRDRFVGSHEFRTDGFDDLVAEVSESVRARTQAAAEVRRVERIERHRREREAVAPVAATLCASCHRRDRHFGDLCKRCANDAGVRPIGKV